MREIKRTRERLEERRAEIAAQPDKVNRAERLELDGNLEERSIQTAHEQVAVSMEADLRKELTEIEDELLDLESEE